MGGTWPPSFTLDRKRVLELLTGDRFYTDRSAALREAVLNAVDATHRRGTAEADFEPEITVIFSRQALTLTVQDNGVGMSREDVVDLFAKVGASAASLDSENGAVGEFGIGVVSYFMAGEAFELRTWDGQADGIGLRFNRSMLAGGEATPINCDVGTRGTTVTLHLSDEETFDLLLHRFPHWCRDVDGLVARVDPEDQPLPQGGSLRAMGAIDVPFPSWIERTHLGPVGEPTGWSAMTGVSTVAVLYRGVFVQEFEVRGAWGIEGSIDVNPKHFKPRLNREGFVEDQFQKEVSDFLHSAHPVILKAMAARLGEAVAEGALTKWSEQRWATLWLAVPRTGAYNETVAAWDAVFRSLPAFELAIGNRWEAVSLERLVETPGDIYVAPLKDERSEERVVAATRFLRSTGEAVVRGVQRDRSWLKHAPPAFGTTADLITNVFAEELGRLRYITREADAILSSIDPIAPLFTGPPPVDLVRLGEESPPAIRLEKRLLINVDHPSGKTIAKEALSENDGALSLVALTARHAHEQLGQVAAVVREMTGVPEVLSPVRRRFIRARLS